MHVNKSLVTLAVLVASFVMVHCHPIDILTQLTDSSDRELLYRIADYLGNDYSDESSYSSAIQTRGVSENQERCRLPMKRGLCRALLPRWLYDPVAKKCIEFKFGG